MQKQYGQGEGAFSTEDPIYPASIKSVRAVVVAGLLHADPRGPIVAWMRRGSSDLEGSWKRRVGLGLATFA